MILATLSYLLWASSLMESNTSRVDEISFTGPDTTEAKSTLQLRQKVKRGKITTLYRHLNLTGDPGLADTDRFMIKKNFKNGQH